MTDSILLDDRAVMLPEHDALIAGDFHFGYGDTPELRGHGQYTAQSRRLTALIDTHAPETLVLNGDIFHEFPFPDAGIDALESICEAMEAIDGRVVATVGNHEEAVGGFGTALPDQIDTGIEIGLGDVRVLHGHHTPTTPADLFVIGHVHPCAPDAGHVTPCYLFGDAASYDTDVLVLPAFNPALSGVNVTTNPSMVAHCPVIGDGEDISTYDIFHAPGTIHL